MILLEPWILMALTAVPLLALLARMASRPRTKVIANLGIWQRVGIGAPSQKRRWFSRFEVLILSAVLLAIFGAAEPGSLIAESPKPTPQLLGQSRSPIASARVDGTWLYVGLNGEDATNYSIQSALNRNALTNPQGARVGSQWLVELPTWGEQSPPLLLTNPNGHPILGLWPEPTSSIDNRALPDDVFKALLSALPAASNAQSPTDHDAWRGDHFSPPTLALITESDSSDHPKLVFLTPIGESSDTVASAPISATRDWADLLADPDFLSAAIRSHPIPPSTSSEPLVWIEAPEGPRVILSRERGVATLYTSIDVVKEHARAAWVPHLISLSTKELLGRDLLDPARYRLFTLPASIGQVGAEADVIERFEEDENSTAGLYRTGVINLPYAELQRETTFFADYRPNARPPVRDLAWLPLTLAFVGLLAAAAIGARPLLATRR